VVLVLQQTGLGLAPNAGAVWSTGWPAARVSSFSC
jgi:hypothetical protein